MILRVVRGRIRPGQRDAVLAAMRADYEPILAATPGLLRFVLGLRPADQGGERLAAMSIWDSLDAVHTAYDGELGVPRTIDGRDRGAIYDSVAYFELEALRRPEHARPAPQFLRVSAGVVGRGLDADIQQGLRSRLPALPAEVIEAYVGRRVIGTTVELSFVSTWVDAPAGVTLDEPIWPDLSARYDTFELEVHDVALVGDGAPAGRD